MSNPVEEFFQHWGIPGMHWGQRKSKRSMGEKSFVTTEPYGQGEIRSTRPNTMHLSNVQLQARISRLKLENDYTALTTPVPKLSPGKKFVDSVLNDSGKKVATKYASEYAIKGIDKAIAAALVKGAVKAAT